MYDLLEEKEEIRFCIVSTHGMISLKHYGQYGA
jgi:hypothetical protein